MDNAVITAIKTRRSIRRYTAEQVSDDELKAVLDAGTYAPTGHNRQDPLIVAVQNPDTIKRLSDLNARIMGKDGDPILRCSDHRARVRAPSGGQPELHQDGSLVLGNMMLAAHSLGLGSCWINREREMSDTAEGKALQKELGIPEEYMGIGALSLGRPARPNPQALPRKEGYWRIVK